MLIPAQKAWAGFGWERLDAEIELAVAALEEWVRWESRKSSTLFLIFD